MIDGGVIWSSTGYSVAAATTANADSTILATFNIPFQQVKSQLYSVYILHGCTNSAITAYLKDLDGRSTGGLFERTRFSVAAATTAGSTGAARNVEGWLLGEGGQIIITADTAISNTTAPAWSIFATIRRL